LAQSLDPAIREALVERVRFYRDLGLTEFYRRPVDAALLIEAAAESTASGKLLAPGADLAADSNTDSQSIQNAAVSILEDTTIPSRKPISAPPQAATAVRPADPAAVLKMIREEIGDCTRCGLHTGRNKLVFGDGSPTARLMFVGEGPGADEDAQGLPFVGKAGQLLNNMIAAMGLKREDVYIANVVKCRPPGNRTPEPVEANTCSPFLFQQIDAVRPQVLVALGATAATYLLGQRQPLAGLRGRVHPYRGMQLIVTYHPAFLLRDPRQKKEAWADLQIAMQELGLKAPAKA
jgi:uracil-DNA glycosylase